MSRKSPYGFSLTKSKTKERAKGLVGRFRILDLRGDINIGRWPIECVVNNEMAVRLGSMTVHITVTEKHWHS